MYVKTHTYLSSVLHAYMCMIDRKEVLTMYYCYNKAYVSLKPLFVDFDNVLMFIFDEFVVLFS